MTDKNLDTNTVKAWDPLIRVFHWSLVVLFLIAFVTEDDWLNLHVQAGYAVSVLIILRLLWGLIGTKNARFMSFVKSPRATLRYFRQMLTCNIPHYLGHNPLGAAMVVALLSSIVLVSVSGMVVIAGDGNGPLAGTIFSSWSGSWIEEGHEFFANFTLLLVGLHVVGVLVSSLLEKDNLAKAMINGRKKNREHWEDVDTGGTH